MQISLRWGDEKQQIHGKTLVLFLPSDKYGVGYMKAVCSQRQLMLSLSVALSTSMAFPYIDLQVAQRHEKKLILSLIYKYYCSAQHGVDQAAAV